MSDSYEYESFVVVPYTNEEGLELSQPGPEWRLVSLSNVMCESERGHSYWETYAVWERKVVSDE